jgi:hypothetical protein
MTGHVRSRWSYALTGIAIGGLALAAAGPAGALPLPESQCADLAKEQASLEAAGVLSDMRQGPDAAKSLSQDRLDHIKHYMDVLADTLFRCTTAVNTKDEKLVRRPVNAGGQSIAGKTAVLTGSAPNSTAKAAKPPRQSP